MSGVGMMLLAAGGASTDIITITTATITAVEFSPTVASAAYSLDLNGGAYEITSTYGTLAIGNWVTPLSSAANYEAYATLVSGTLTSGTTGSWLALTSTRTWSRNRGGLSPGVNQAVITVDIRKIGTTTVLDTATITLQAETQ